MHRSEFIKAVKEAFPELKDAINQQDGNLGLEVWEFIKFTQQTIYDGDHERIKKCFSLAEQAFLKGNAALKKSIDAYIGHDLEFIGDQSSGNKSYLFAWKLFPKSLKEPHLAYHSTLGFRDWYVTALRAHD